MNDDRDYLLLSAYVAACCLVGALLTLIVRAFL